MATSIGNLAVILSANAGQFTSGMKRAGASTQQFSVQANRSLSSVGAGMASLGRMALRLGPLLGVGLGVGTLVSEMNRLDEVGKTSERLGVAADELTRLQFAGEQTGVQISTMNMALQRMTRRVAEAAAGTGEAKDAIKELGLDAVALNAMGPAEAFKAIADRMKLVENSSDRVRLAMKLFDSEGVRLVNTLNLGSQGLAEMGKRSDEVGNTAFPDAIRKATELIDTINELRKSIGGAAGELVKALAPALKQTISALTDGIKSLRNLNGETVKNVVQVTAMAAGFAAAVAAAGKFVTLGVTIISTIKNITKAASVMQVVINPGSILKIAAGLAAAVAVGVAVEKAFDGMAESAKNAAAQVQTLGTESDKVATQAERDAASLAKLSGSMIDAFAGEGKNRPEVVAREYVSAFGEIEKAIKSLQDRASSIFDATRTDAERTAAKLKEISELTSQGFLDPETARRAIAQLNDAQQPRNFNMPSPADMSSQRVDFAALGAENAAGRKEDKIEKNTAEEVKQSKKQTAALAELLKIGRNSQGAAITITRF